MICLPHLMILGQIRWVYSSSECFLESLNKENIDFCHKWVTLRRVISKLLNNLISIPTIKAIRIANWIISFLPLLTSAATIEVITMTPPTDRSNPATSMTIVWPIAIIPSWAHCQNIKASVSFSNIYGVIRPKIISRITRVKYAPYCSMICLNL